MTATHQRPLLAWIIGSAATLGLALAVDLWIIPTQVLTPFGEQRALSPLYAFWMPRFSPRVIGVLAVAVAYVAWVLFTWSWWRAVEVRWRGANVARVFIHCGWLIAFAVALAAVRLELTNLGASMHVYPGEEFWDDVPKVESPSQFLRDFPQLHLRNRLSLHGRTHPPGHTLFLWAVVQMFGSSSQAAAIAILLVGSSGLFPLYYLARRVGGLETAGRVIAFYPVIPSVAIFAVSSTDFLFAAIASWSLWLAVEAVLGRSAIVAVAAGLVAGVAAMFSFAEAFVGLMVALFALAHWIGGRSGAEVARQLGWMAGGLLLTYFVLRVVFDFDWLEAQQLTRRWYWHVVRAVPGRLTLGFWLYVMFGNLVALAWYAGLPVVAGSALSVRSLFERPFWTEQVAGQFTRAVWLTLGLLNFGGVFVLITLEVERIWLFLLGPILVAACYALPAWRDNGSERRWMTALVTFLCIQAIAYELFFFTIW